MISGSEYISHHLPEEPNEHICTCCHKHLHLGDFVFSYSNLNTTSGGKSFILLCRNCIPKFFNAFIQDYVKCEARQLAYAEHQHERITKAIKELYDWMQDPYSHSNKGKP